MRNIVSPLIETLETRRFLSGSAPAAPSALIETTSSDSTISLTWTDNSSNETGFRVDRWNGHGWGKIAKVPANAKTFTDTHLKASKFYAYRVFAYNKAGNSTASAFIGDASTVAKGDIASPSALTATVVSPSHIIVQFVDHSTKELGYNIEASTNGDAGPWTFAGGVKGDATTGARLFDFSNAQPGLTYSFRIAGYTASRVSGFSKSATSTSPISGARNAVLSNGQYYTSETVQDPAVSTNVDLILHRWNADGSIDTTFGTNGSYNFQVSVNPLYAETKIIAGLPNGNILAINFSVFGGQLPMEKQSPGIVVSILGPGSSIPPDAQFLVALFDYNGALDQHSGPFPPTPHFFVGTDGKILVATDMVHTLVPPGGKPGPLLTLLNADLTEAWSTPLATFPDSVAILPNGVAAAVTGSTISLFDANGKAIAE